MEKGWRSALLKTISSESSLRRLRKICVKMGEQGEAMGRYVFFDEGINNASISLGFYGLLVVFYSPCATCCVLHAEFFSTFWWFSLS